jgi:putative ABC transport system ATP-binding protein
MIQVKNLTHYYNKEIALDNINLTIEKGKFIAIVGESGSGKSTLLSILSTLLKPTKAEITLLDTNTKKIKAIDDFRKTNIGFVFQFHYLINYLTVKENIELALDEKEDKKTLENLKLLGIEELQNRYPNEISGGQRQRVSIARALTNQPKIIFADEPTGNLDSKNSLKVFELLKQLCENGTTIVVATHDKKLAKLADTIYEMSDGKISNIY